jgi:hypothetical protein
MLPWWADSSTSMRTSEGVVIMWRMSRSGASAEARKREESHATGTETGPEQPIADLQQRQAVECDKGRVDTRHALGQEIAK